jgi:hypothetical protein
MNDLSLVEENYKRLSIDELIRISEDPEVLNPEAIKLLQRELIARNHSEEALALTEFLLSGSRRLSFMSLEELQKVVFERLESGESIESIKIDLKENGINVIDIINAEGKEREKAFDYMLALKNNGLDDMEVKEKMQETFSIDENDSEVIHAQFKKRGWQNMVIGISLVCIVGLLVAVSMNTRNGIGIGAVLVAATGVWRIIVGSRQLRN